MSETLVLLAKTSQPTTSTTHEETPQSPTTPTAPKHEMDKLPSPFSNPSPNFTADEPLYTEINIPLPVIPKRKASTSSSRLRAHTLHSFRPFHRRGSSADSSSSKSSALEHEEWPRIKKEVKSKEVAAAMNLRKAHWRSGTVDALAVVPAVLVLSAELFTPEDEGNRRKRGRREGKWEDGMM